MHACIANGSQVVAMAMACIHGNIALCREACSPPLTCLGPSLHICTSLPPSSSLPILASLIHIYLYVSISPFLSYPILSYPILGGDRLMAMSSASGGDSRRRVTILLCLLLLLVVNVVAQAQAVEFELVPAAAAADSPMMMMTPMDDQEDQQDDQQQQQQCSNPPVSVEEACRSASETHAGVSYDHCVASLGADPRSREEEAGGMHGLAVLATKQAIDHAASTESKIDDLAELEPESETTPQARARFNHCLEQYGGAADLLRDALDNLRAQIYGKAMEQLSAALGASESCEDAWKGAREEEKQRIPVAPHDREYGRMAHIALGFTHHAAA